MTPMSKSYSLDIHELQDLTGICYREQGRSEAGIKACASQMCNYHDAFWSDKNKTPYQTVIHSGWYGSAKEVVDGMLVYRSLVTDEMVEWVRDVICNGNRTLPEYVVEYDCLSDIRKATNDGTEIDIEDRTAYIPHTTRIYNVYGTDADSYTFFCFPDGADGHCDAFGYFSKPEKEDKSMVTAKDILDIARSWIGRNEYDGSHKYIIDLYNAHTPLARGYRVKYTDQWCDTCVSAMFIKAGATDLIGGTECGVEEHVKLFKKAGIWIEDGNITPKAGDIIVFNWDDSTQPNDGYSDHIGIVESVNGNTITTIEGNYHDSVARRIIPVGYGYIRGYARPKYGLVDEIVIEEPDIIAPSEPDNGSYAFNVDTVQNGTKSASARLLQILLKGLGYYGSNGKVLSIDGDAGANTVYAIRSYQRSNGLVEDGVCGPATWKKILGV